MLGEVIWWSKNEVRRSWWFLWYPLLKILI